MTFGVPHMQPKVCLFPLREMLSPDVALEGEE